MKNTPHFLIVGAPKAGTTSLYKYLMQHPNIYMPKNKEPRFFCNYDVSKFEFGIKHFHPDIICTAEDYLELFSSAPFETICGEASTDYLSVSQAPELIYQWNPLIKIIILLRNPIDRAYSEYQHSIRGGFQECAFWESLKMEDERVKQHYDPIFWHVRRGLYFKAVNRYYERFGKSQVKVILFDDFSRNTAAVVQSVFRFLDLDEHEVNVSERFNTAHGDQQETSALSGIRKRIMVLKQQLVGVKLDKSKEQSGVKSVLTSEQYAHLKAQFRNDLIDLQNLLNVDLQAWL